MQRTDRDVMQPRIGQCLIAGPIQKGAELDQPVLRIDFREGRLAACDRLIGSKASDPASSARQGSPQGLNLADHAAGLASLD